MPNHLSLRPTAFVAAPFGLDERVARIAGQGYLEMST